MKKLLENLKEAINFYEKCEEVCACEHLIAKSLRSLNKCCKEVSEKCEIMYNTIPNNNIN